MHQLEPTTASPHLTQACISFVQGYAVGIVCLPLRCRSPSLLLNTTCAAGRCSQCWVVSSQRTTRQSACGQLHLMARRSQSPLCTGPCLYVTLMACSLTSYPFGTCPPGSRWPLTKDGFCSCMRICALFCAATELLCYIDDSKSGGGVACFNRISLLSSARALIMHPWAAMPGCYNQEAIGAHAKLHVFKLHVFKDRFGLKEAQT